MTALEFELDYAAAMGLTVDELRAFGRIVGPCNCDWDGCQGWASYPADMLANLKAMGKVDPEWGWPPTN